LTSHRFIKNAYTFKENSRLGTPDSIGFDAALGSDFVIDIGGGRLDGTCKAEIEKKLLWKWGQFQEDRVLPSSVLHDDEGLMMWGDMTRLPQYYQTKDEIELLQQNGADLAGSLSTTAALIDLGCG
jgi:4-dimethylallyltryptophan N-methyltransferase